MIETAFLLKRPYFETTKSFFESESSDDTNGKQNHSSVSEDLSPNNTSDTSSQEIISLSSFPGTLGNTALLTGENYGTDVQIEPCLIFDYEIENGAPICLSKNSIFSIFSQSAKLF